MSGNRLIRLLLLSVNLLMIAALLLSDLAPWVNPNTLLFPAFFGLAFLPLVAVNIVYILFWLLLKPKYIVFGLIAMVLSLPNLSRHMQFNLGATPDVQDLHVLSYNVRLFDLYNWSNNDKTRDKILDYFQSKQPDVLCLQEYFRSSDPRYFNTLDTIKKTGLAPHVHEHFTAELHNGLNKFGIATMSQHPIVYRGHVPLDTAGHNVAIYTDIAWNDDTIRIFNLHLASVHLSAMEKDINKHIEVMDQQQQWNDLKLMARKLAGGYKKRARQADHIASYIAKSPHPVIVCGDFNDSPGSYAYRRIKGALQDSFQSKGKGLGSTYLGFLPVLRIDYIMHDDQLSLRHFETDGVEFSDHRPLNAYFSP